MTLPISIVRPIDCASSGGGSSATPRRWCPESPASHAAEERHFGAERVRMFRRSPHRSDAIRESPSRADGSSRTAAQEAPAFVSRENTPDCKRRPSDEAAVVKTI